MARQRAKGYCAGPNAILRFAAGLLFGKTCCSRGTDTQRERGACVTLISFAAAAPSAADVPLEPKEVLRSAKERKKDWRLRRECRERANARQVGFSGAKTPQVQLQR